MQDESVRCHFCSLGPYNLWRMFNTGTNRTAVHSEWTLVSSLLLQHTLNKKIKKSFYEIHDKRVLLIQKNFINSSAKMADSTGNFILNSCIENLIWSFLKGIGPNLTYDMYINQF